VYQWHNGKWYKGAPCTRAWRHAGLAHLELLYYLFQADNTTRLEIDPVRLTDVKRCYNTLRQLDARDPRGSKYIILDLSSDDALRSVLKQVTRYRRKISRTMLISAVSTCSYDRPSALHRASIGTCSYCNDLAGTFTLTSSTVVTDIVFNRGSELRVI